MGVRGGSLHKTLFEDIEMPLTEYDKERGRDAELLMLRNEHLLYRYIFIGTMHPEMKYEFIVKQLVKEFYLSESTIGQIIAKNGDVLHRIRKENNDLRLLREKYPFFKWS